ncbi:hypothetical protein evm_002401 [Chilo suppressalis]|nr:hypothetical protein evm_002401 [Chilo suppressalis]
MEAAKVIMAGLLVVGVVPSMRADMVVMKDITLGFGAALEHCREEYKRERKTKDTDDLYCNICLTKLYLIIIGEKLSKVLVQVIHECEKKFDHEEDHCWRILHIGECFRDMCRSQNIAPDMEMLLAEFIMQAESDTNPVAL